MIPLNNIDLLSFQENLKYDRDSLGQLLVLDPVRKKYIRTTPEEIVRQLWIVYFLNILKLNIKLIAVERLFVINGMPRRFDLVIFGKSTQPILLAEFKGPGIRIQQSVFDQIAQYNMKLQVPYSLVSNGSEHYCFQIDDEVKGFIWQENLPVLIS
ncbi:MAG TPA: type I restriction enzyme HsdR N-terminal domain-containing protein [Saprospiraceae bacterium]|nr:type I restriction enzyme HsdR N-terminal domain-containing protein [Saprospiraceae bacterium]